MKGMLVTLQNLPREKLYKIVQLVHIKNSPKEIVW